MIIKNKIKRKRKFKNKIGDTMAKKIILKKSERTQLKSKRDEKNKIGEAVKVLNENPNNENWAKFSAELKNSKAKHYKIFYPDALKGKDNLTKAYAVLYDSQFKVLFKIPVISINNKSVNGATIYLKELTLNRR